MRRHELSDEEWAIIAPLLPNNSRGIERVDDRRVINGILWRFRTGSSWRDVPERYDGEIVMIDSSSVRVHQHGANAKKGDLPILAWDVRAAA